MNDIVIIGGGHAAAQLCASLAEAGLARRVVLVGDEGVVPYQRPPLSKGFLKSAGGATQALRGEAWFQEQGVELRLGDRAVAIDRERAVVTLASGAELPWSHLVLATGARARALPGLPADLENVATLRNAADAQALRGRLESAARLTVIGGGFVGLEVAATARALGKEVTLLEAAPRLLARAASTPLSAHVLDAHRGAGIDVRVGVRCGALDVQGRHLRAIEVDGAMQPVELLLVAIGASPETSLASACGLACDDGILVDAHMRSSDARVLAIGDCTRFVEPRVGARLRLESIQNANDQARTAAATLAGTPREHDALPWFWSDQGGLRLQMAGLLPTGDAARLQTVCRPMGSTGHSWFHFEGDRLACVESVNAAADHMMARKLLERRQSPPAAALADATVPLKSLVV